MITNIKRGDIFYADLSPVVGSEQGGLRPVLIIQNDVGNRYSPTVIAAAITSRMGKTRLPTHIDIHADRVGQATSSSGIHWMISPSSPMMKCARTAVSVWVSK